MPSCQFVQTLVPTPLGILTLIADVHGLVCILWPNAKSDAVGRPGLVACTGDNPHLRSCRLALEKYFSKQPFDIPTLNIIGTDFQKSVWEALRRIPF